MMKPFAEYRHAYFKFRQGQGHSVRLFFFFSSLAQLVGH